MTPEFDGAVEIVAKYDLPVNLAKVDVTQEKEASKKHKFGDGVPRMWLFV